MALVINSNSSWDEAEKINESSSLGIKIIDLEAASAQLELTGITATWPEPLVFKKKKKNPNSYVKHLTFKC